MSIYFYPASYFFPAYMKYNIEDENMSLAGNTIEIIKKFAFLTTLFVVMLEMLHFKCAIREQRKTNFTPMALAF